ncbi:MAG: lipoyl(octanoyl) transferase LipB [Aeromonadaceae bacterium]
MQQSTLIVRHLGVRPYLDTWQAMQRFTDERDGDTPDEIWLLEHEPVYTQGQAGKAEHLLHQSAIPVVQSDRGGQITYHGPGQLIAYLLIDIRRKGLGVRELVTHLERAVITMLEHCHIQANSKPDAPGVYVQGDKIASLGLRIRRGCSFHGLALNVNMDLTPFTHINPCGYAGLAMTQCSALQGPTTVEAAIPLLLAELTRELGYASWIESIEGK